MRQIATLALLLLSFSIGVAQTSSHNTVNETQFSVPRLIKLNGVLSDVTGQTRSGSVGVTFAIYKDAEGGVALWQEVQNVTLDAAGYYSVLLGSSSSEGLPLDVFASGEARWLGIRLEQEPEQPRTLLVAVPYALKAADAETLGGKPASSFVTTEQFSSGSAVSPNRIQTSIVSGGTPLAANVTGSGSQDMIPKFDSSGTNLAVRPNVAVSGMMLSFVPAWICPTVTTARVPGASSRETISCSVTMIREAISTGSIDASGRAPCAPLPNTVMSIVSALA